MSGNYGYRIPATVFVGIGKRIDDLQFEQNVSVMDIARATGLHRCVIFRIKNNNDVMMSSLIAIANYFNVSLDYLVYGKE